MNPLRTVGGRLTIALLLVVTGALGIAYLVVVPQLQSRLIDQRAAQLRKDLQPQVVGAAIHAADTAFTGDNPQWDLWAEQISERVRARVVLYDVVGRNPLKLQVLGDTGSTALVRDVFKDRLVAKAATENDIIEGVVPRRGDKFAEIVVPPAALRPGDAASPWILVSTDLSDTVDTVTLVKRRLLYAALIALGVALIIGFVAARMFARRVRRLERAADRIAAGYFDQPVVDKGHDEIGELAAAFERMRQRLAHLEHARREFIANASHELRTPVFALAGLLELLADEELDDETRREFVMTAREQSDRLTKLATELLDLSRLDAGRLHLEREHVELDELARGLADEFRAVAQSREHPLEILGAPATAVADEQRLLQVGRILVENALLHTPPGTTVRVRTSTRDGQAVLSVEDAGPGIPREHWEPVFERFYRVNGTVTSGGGLGLAIARELTQLMGGTIDLDSGPGRTVFTVRLPAAVTREAALPVG